MSKMRFHALGLPHTVTSKEYLSCAYTQKVLKFCKMFHNLGYEVIHYGHENSEVECSEHVTVTNDQVLKDTYGDLDFKKDFFKHNTADHASQTFLRNTIEEMKTRVQPNDFILCFWGYGHQPIAEAYPQAIAVEPGIGYSSGCFANYRVFESYCIANYVYGTENNPRPRWYDSIIPNYFEVEDFEFVDKDGKEDYFLYLGRIIEGKGVDIAVQVTKHLGKKLKIAGQGDFKTELGYDMPDHVEHVGFADVEKRKELMSKAQCLLMPTYYNEPFGGVMVEALLSGTPIITTDWGAFAENNLHGLTGYRCRTFEQFMWAAKNIDKIDNKYCRQFAEANFSLEKVSQMYVEYFEMVHKIYVNTEGSFSENPKGFYSMNPSRTELDWLEKKFIF